MTKKRNLKNKNTLKVVPDKESVLLRLYNNRLLRTKVDNALDEGVGFDDIIELCLQYELEISKPSLSRYKNKRKEAIENGWDLGEYLDKRKKSSVTDIEDKKASIIPLEDAELNPFEASMKHTQTIYDDIQVLDSIIQKGATGLQFVDTIDPALAIRAMETKHKITDGQLKGISLVGLRELQLKQTAKETAMTEVLLEFVPENKHEELLQRMEQVEKEFYSNLDLEEEDRKLREALDRVGYSF